MKRKLLSILPLAAVLLLAACGGVSQIPLAVDKTEPIAEGNRVIYQMNVGAFTAEGTFQAAAQQLGRLDTLGIDIIWLMPIYPRGATVNSPYAAMDYKAVNPKYGTVDDPVPDCTTVPSFLEIVKSKNWTKKYYYLAIILNTML